MVVRIEYGIAGVVAHSDSSESSAQSLFPSHQLSSGIHFLSLLHSNSTSSQFVLKMSSSSLPPPLSPSNISSLELGPVVVETFPEGKLSGHRTASSSSPSGQSFCPSHNCTSQICTFGFLAHATASSPRHRFTDRRILLRRKDALTKL